MELFLNKMRKFIWGPGKNKTVPYAGVLVTAPVLAIMPSENSLLTFLSPRIQCEKHWSVTSDRAKIMCISASSISVSYV
jgi:hypothetical protein